MALETRAQVITAIMNIINGMIFSSPINGATTWVTGPSYPQNPAIQAKLRLWGDVAVDQQPAAFLVTHNELDEYRGLGLLRRRLNLGVWCYSRGDAIPGASQLDIMMEAFEKAFCVVDSFSTNCNTLGGLVYWCRIEGKIFKDPGDIDPSSQTLLIVPIVVEMP